jgi:tetratricopeptide (TPR) repeat protein
MNTGNVYRNKGNLDTALDYYMKSKTIRDSLGLQKTTEYALLLNNIGIVYEKQGKKTLAGQHYRKAYETYESAGYMGEFKEKVRKNAERLGY